ncbi:YceI family protein [Acidipila sp. EB88]|uniref:YceI family protein n=1 Tax=Acidipila sp. EB88 TaxID=2305226 RepID=UPI0013155F51|nr:YceI family protein [Acidipila sp. EB88]
MIARNFVVQGLVAAATCVALPALAQQGAAGSSPSTVSVHLDPQRTTVSFNAGSIHHVHGTFQLKTGVFALDSKSGVAQGEILVDADSEKSNDSKLDQKLHTQTLETAKYPGIFFHAEKVTGSLPAKDGTSQLKLEGSFNIHGADHPLLVDVDATRQGDTVLLKSRFSVPYVQWGMKDAGTLLMRDKVIQITVESHGTVEGLEPKGS